MVFCTRFVIDQTEPLTLAFFRFGIGFVCVAPVLARRDRPRMPTGRLGRYRWPRRPPVRADAYPGQRRATVQLRLTRRTGARLTARAHPAAGTLARRGAAHAGQAVRHRAGHGRPGAGPQRGSPPDLLRIDMGRGCAAVRRGLVHSRLQRLLAAPAPALSGPRVHGAQHGYRRPQPRPFCPRVGPGPGLAGLHPLGLGRRAVYRHVWGRDRLCLMGLGFGPYQSHPGGHLPDAQSSDRHAVGRRFSGRADYPALRHGPAGRAGRHRCRSRYPDSGRAG